MMKGYLTVFLSVSLSILTGFVLLLTGYAVRNAGKIRLECAADISMNSTLAEFGTALHERYALLYVDASYLNKEPSLSNLEERLNLYLNRNLNMYSEDQPWKQITLQNVVITEVVTAAQGNGSSMKYQAAQYIQDSGICREEAEIFDYLETVKTLDNKNTMQEWAALQEEIAGIELPLIINEEGQWEEVSLDNPADRIFGLSGSDIFYLLDMDMNSISSFQIRENAYISGRRIENMADTASREAADELFLSYLFEKMGNYRNEKEDSLLRCQLEYIAMGETSDYKNLRSVAEKLLAWRFAVNISYISDQGSLYGEASQLAESLWAVQLKEELKEPVTQSILYACAYLEALYEVKSLFAGGRAAIEKNSWHTAMEQVLTGEVSAAGLENTGLSYEQYLACMLMFLSEEVRNLRSMDIMEMDIRSITGNPYFAMDWCIERYRAEISADGAALSSYYLNRTYGYY